MKITIEINCDDDMQDVKTHLSVIRDQIKKRLNYSLDKFDLTPVKFEDNNCYGSHNVEIQFEE